MRIKQPAINVQFCLKLPQALYDSETGVVKPVFTPTKAKPDTVNSLSQKSIYLQKPMKNKTVQTKAMTINEVVLCLHRRLVVVRL